METFENMAQRYYLEIYPNCTENGTILRANSGMTDRFISGYAGRPEKKAGGGLIMKVQDLFGAAGGNIADERGSIDLGFLLNRSRKSNHEYKIPQYGQSDAYIPDMRLSIFNR